MFKQSEAFNLFFISKLLHGQLYTKMKTQHRGHQGVSSGAHGGQPCDIFLKIKTIFPIFNQKEAKIKMNVQK